MSPMITEWDGPKREPSISSGADTVMRGTSSYGCCGTKSTVLCRFPGRDRSPALRPPPGRSVRQRTHDAPTSGKPFASTKEEGDADAADAESGHRLSRAQARPHRRRVDPRGREQLAR